MVDAVIILIANPAARLGPGFLQSFKLMSLHDR